MYDLFFFIPYILVDDSGWVVSDVSFGIMGGFGSFNIRPPHPNDPVGIDLTPTPIPAANLRIHTRRKTKYSLYITFLNNPKFICLCTVKWLCIWFVSQQFVGYLIFKWVKANLFAHKFYCCLYVVKWSFLLLRIQFNVSHLFVHSLNVKYFYLTHR